MFLEQIWWDNPVSQWLIAVLVFLLVILFSWIVKRILLQRVSHAMQRRWPYGLGRFLENLINQTRGLFILIFAIFLASWTLALPEPARAFLRSFFILALFILAGFWGGALIEYLIYRKLEQGQPEAGVELQDKALGPLNVIAKAVLWVVLALLILQNVAGVQVDALLASLGIAGIAVALAVQNILGDLFSALTIMLDKPFEEGDFISVGDFSGSIEKIGLKSTRLRSISGEQVVIANSDLLNSRIRNYKRMQRRRVLFTLGVTYQTPAEKLAAIPEMLRQVIESYETVTFDQAHFKSFGDFALLFEVVFFMETPDFGPYMDTLQAINLDIYRKFEEAQIQFAYPTQTIFMEK